MASEAAPSSPSQGRKAKGGKSKLILIVAVLVLLFGGGGGGGYWFFVMKPPGGGGGRRGRGSGRRRGREDTAATRSKKKGAGEERAAALKFDPFVVNLADEGGSRYLRVGLSLVIEGERSRGQGTRGEQGQAAAHPLGRPRTADAADRRTRGDARKASRN